MLRHPFKLVTIDKAFVTIRPITCLTNFVFLLNVVILLVNLLHMATVASAWSMHSLILQNSTNDYTYSHH